MTARQKSPPSRPFLAIDVSKAWNTVLVETPDGKRRRFKVANKRADHDRLVSFLNQQPGECHVALEPTGMYHRKRSRSDVLPLSLLVGFQCDIPRGGVDEGDEQRSEASF